MVNQLLETVRRWGQRCGLDDFEIATAQSLAWYYEATYDGDELPVSHWAQLGVRAVRNGRDLPDCGTGAKDALNFTWQGAGMLEVTDGYPGPDTLAAHREIFDRMFSGLDDLKKQVAELKMAGERTKEIAVHLHLSEARISQISREIVEACRKDK
jgi:hypothetical protein